MAAVSPSLILLDLQDEYRRFEAMFDPQLFCRFTNKTQCLQQVSSHTNIRLLHFFIPKSEHVEIGAGIVFLNTIFYLYCIDQGSENEMIQRYPQRLFVKIFNAGSLLTFLHQAALAHYTEQAERRKHEPDEYNYALQAAIDQSLALANELKEHMLEQIGVQPDDR